MTSSRAVPVTLAEIARLAGVGRAAVSNWRRRHDSFPERIGGTDVSPQFSLTDIESWLRDNNKLQKATGRAWLWPQVEALGSRDEAGRAIATAGRLMRGEPTGRKATGAPGQAELSGLSRPAQKLVSQVLELGRREGARETFAFLLRRWLDTNVRQITTTPEPLARLMADLAFRARDRPVTDDGSALTVLDPACGTGHLLAAAAENSPAVLRGCDSDPVLALLAEARLGLLPPAAGTGSTTEVKTGDSLRADPLSGTRADVALCNPPFNERDWGYEELATDARWAHGMPPRTEPELAWVQHCLARLRPGGTAVVLLPPAVATRKAGRRIRGSLLRTGLLRAVVALPPGCAAPHSVSLQLWVLRAPAPGKPTQGTGELLLADGTSRFPKATARDSAPDWEELGAFVRAAFDAADAREYGTDESPAPHKRALPKCVAFVPVIDLLDDEVDLTPGRHIAPVTSDDGSRLTDSWAEFRALVTHVDGMGRHLAALGLTDDAAAVPSTTVGELARAGALTLRSGQQPVGGTVSEGLPGTDGISLLTVPDLLVGGEPRGWLARADAEAVDVLVAEAGDIVVAGVARAFSAWVHQGPPVALGPQLHALRVHPEQLDVWFLAGSLRAPANARQAGTHASSSSRVDVRKLQVRQIPLDEQRQYGERFRLVTAFEGAVARLNALGKDLVHELSDALAAGRLPAAQ